MLFFIGFLAGGAAIWFGKDPITLWYKGAENVIGDLNDKIKDIKARM